MLSPQQCTRERVQYSRWHPPNKLPTKECACVRRGNKIRWLSSLPPPCPHTHYKCIDKTPHLHTHTRTQSCKKTNIFPAHIIIFPMKLTLSVNHAQGFSLMELISPEQLLSSICIADTCCNQRLRPGAEEGCGKSWRQLPAAMLLHRKWKQNNYSDNCPT